jgi:hypothetical protein
MISFIFGAGFELYYFLFVFGVGGDDDAADLFFITEAPAVVVIV